MNHSLLKEWFCFNKNPNFSLLLNISFQIEVEPVNDLK
jgi:hypothetical protein